MIFFNKKHPSKEVFIFFSDLHLTESEDHREVWKNFKESKHHPDRDLITLIQEFQKSYPGYHHNIVLNGDSFDFRMVLSRPDGKQDNQGLKATLKNSTWKMEKILKEHISFASFLSRFAEKGSIHLIPGNHDLELNLAAVRRTFRHFLYEISPRNLIAKKFHKNIRFYQNHFYRPKFFYVEHGHHYDAYCTLPAHRTLTGRKNKRQLVLPFGDYASIYMTNKMGHFNPFHADSYLLSTGQYVKIFFKYNLKRMFTKNDLFFNWLFGSIRTFLKALWAVKSLRKAKLTKPMDTEMDNQSFASISELYPKNIYFDWGLMWRTLWLDRIFVFSINTFFIVALLFSWKMIILLPLVAIGNYFYFKIRNRVKDISPEDIDASIVGEKIDKILNIPYTILGHTHNPQKKLLREENNTQHYFYDLGSWSPNFFDVECKNANHKKRYFLILSKNKKKLSSVFSNWPAFIENNKSLINLDDS